MIQQIVAMEAAEGEEAPAQGAVAPAQHTAIGRFL